VAHRLKSDPQVWRLAADLGLRPTANPVADIRAFCRTRLRAFLRDFPCATLRDLLETATAQLDTLFVEVRSDEHLDQVKREYVTKGELVFATLDTQLGPDTFAITFRRRRALPGERAFVSVIDCRGEKAWRAYFSKWHELAHLLTLTDQARLSFCRTHSDIEHRDPEEALMDVLAGDGGFFADLVTPHADGLLTFDKVASLRDRLCPAASDQASLIGFVRAWPHPALLLRAQPALKKSEQARRTQGSFAFRTAPSPALRAVQVTVNEHASTSGLSIPPNMRVPETSVIHRLFSGGEEFSEADEDLSWWTSSDGGRLATLSVHVAARRRGDHVQAIVVPDPRVDSFRVIGSGQPKAARKANRGNR
jgi:hypothetical protein